MQKLGALGLKPILFWTQYGKPPNKRNHFEVIEFGDEHKDVFEAMKTAYGHLQSVGKKLIIIIIIILI